MLSKDEKGAIFVMELGQATGREDAMMDWRFWMFVFVLMTGVGCNIKDDTSVGGGSEEVDARVDITEPVDGVSDTVAEDAAADAEDEDTGAPDSAVEDTSSEDASVGQDSSMDADDVEGPDDASDASDAVVEMDSGSDTSADAGPPAWQQCRGPADCVIKSSSCCDVCGEPSISDVDGVNKNLVDEHYAEVCPNAPVSCPRCLHTPNPNLVATCQDTLCEVRDIVEEPFTQCRSDDDCRVRVRGCCECGGDTSPESLIAINATRVGDYTNLVCNTGTICAGCVPTYPAGVQAVCNASSRCEVVQR